MSKSHDKYYSDVIRNLRSELERLKTSLFRIKEAELLEDAHEIAGTAIRNCKEAKVTWDFLHLEPTDDHQ